jgi:four helix bundle protein
MKYGRFEELPVRKDGIKLALQVYELTENECFKGKSSLKDQPERAAVSVSNNIAEGFERGTTQELLTFIYIARGSAAEVRSMYLIACRFSQISNLKSQI